ncbi:MAG: ferredoxin family protein [Anaerolineae bacterium]
MGTIIIDQEHCKGCGLCISVCPQHVIRLDESLFNQKGFHPAQLSETTASCTGCAVCAVICPDVAISVYREPTTFGKLKILEGF